jgi:hypothetical protein
MENRSTYGYIFLGTAVRYLIDATPNTKVFGSGAIDSNISDLRQRLEEYGFHVTWRLAGSFDELQVPWRNELLANDADQTWRDSRVLSSQELSKVTQLAGNVRETMLAEALGKRAYIAQDKRYSVEILLDDISKLMASGVYEALPDIAKFDLEEAGKALAFDLPTAAAFHILRGTESVLRDFYSRVVRRNRIPEPRMWFKMVDDLRSKTNGPPHLVLENLDSLRRHFRNPTQHPEKTYDLDETQDLLALSIDSINRMVKHLTAKGL